MRDYGNDVAMILNKAKKEAVNLANEAYKTGYNDGLKDQEYTAKQYDEIFQRGYSKGYEKRQSELTHDVIDQAYRRGLNNAWECAKKIITMSKRELEEYGLSSVYHAFNILTATECIRKIKEYEEIQTDDEIKAAQEKDDCEDSHEIRVGDVVTWKGNEERNYTMLVVKKYTQHGSGKYAVVTSLGDYIDYVKLDDIRKIRHIDDLEPVFGKR